MLDTLKVIHTVDGWLFKNMHWSFYPSVEKEMIVQEVFSAATCLMKKKPEIQIEPFRYDAKTPFFDGLMTELNVMLRLMTKLYSRLIFLAHKPN